MLISSVVLGAWVLGVLALIAAFILVALVIKGLQWCFGGDGISLRKAITDDDSTIRDFPSLSNFLDDLEEKKYNWGKSDLTADEMLDSLLNEKRVMTVRFQNGEIDSKGTIITEFDQIKQLLNVKIAGMKEALLSAIVTPDILRRVIEIMKVNHLDDELNELFDMFTIDANPEQKYDDQGLEQKNANQAQVKTLRTDFLEAITTPEIFDLLMKNHLLRNFDQLLRLAVKDSKGNYPLFDLMLHPQIFDSLIDKEIIPNIEEIEQLLAIDRTAMSAVILQPKNCKILLDDVGVDRDHDALIKLIEIDPPLVFKRIIEHQVVMKFDGLKQLVKMNPVGMFEAIKTPENLKLLIGKKNGIIAKFDDIQKLVQVFSGLNAGGNEESKSEKKKDGLGTPFLKALMNPEIFKLLLEEEVIGSVKELQQLAEINGAVVSAAILALQNFEFLKDGIIKTLEDIQLLSNICQGEQDKFFEILLFIFNRHAIFFDKQGISSLISDVNELIQLVQMNPPMVLKAILLPKNFENLTGEGKLIESFDDFKRVFANKNGQKIEGLDKSLTHKDVIIPSV